MKDNNLTKFVRKVGLPGQASTLVYREYEADRMQSGECLSESPSLSQAMQNQISKENPSGCRPTKKQFVSAISGE